jgi:hypothetical protein
MFLHVSVQTFQRLISIVVNLQFPEAYLLSKSKSDTSGQEIPHVLWGVNTLTVPKNCVTLSSAEPNELSTQITQISRIRKFLQFAKKSVIVSYFKRGEFSTQIRTFCRIRTFLQFPCKCQFLSLSLSLSLLHPFKA